MNALTRKPVSLGFAAGVALTITSAVLMGQGASTPVKSDTQYFVTGEGDAAHLWVREGTNLRCVGHGECAAHKHSEGDGHDHHEGDGHDHGTNPGAPKKP
jgi:hypothetical protein